MRLKTVSGLWPGKKLSSDRGEFDTTVVSSLLFCKHLHLLGDAFLFVVVQLCCCQQGKLRDQMSNSVVEKRRFGLLAHPDPWQKIEVCMRELADMLKRARGQVSVMVWNGLDILTRSFVMFC